jgi:hypothetical protein
MLEYNSTHYTRSFSVSTLLAIKDRDVTAIRVIYDRVDGKPVESIDMAAAVNADVRVTHMSPEEQMQRITELAGKLGFKRAE